MKKIKNSNSRFKYYLKHGDQIQSDINISLSAGGALHDLETKGISHFLEHVLVSETNKLTYDNHQKYLFENDLYTNASTGTTLMNFTGSSHYSDFTKLFELALDYIFSPSFSDEVIERERDVILREILERKGDTGYILNQFIKESTYVEGSIGLVDVLGNEESISSINKSQLQDRHKKMLDESCILISAIGKGVYTRKIKALTNKFDKSDDDNSYFIPTINNVRNKLKEFKVLKLHHEYAHEEIILGIFIPFEIDYQDDAKLQIFHEMIFNTPHGILYKTLREKLRLVYSVAGFYDLYLRGFMVTMLMTPSQTEQLINVIHEMFSKIYTLLDENKFNIIKSHFMKRNEITLDKPIESLIFSSNLFLERGIEDDLKNYLIKLNEIEFNDVINLSKSFSNIYSASQYILVSKNKKIDDIKNSLFQI